MDPRLAKAREAHEASRVLSSKAHMQREMRNWLIVKLHKDGFSYGAMAKAVGCSPELVAKVVQKKAGTDNGISDR